MSDFKKRQEERTAWRKGFFEKAVPLTVPLPLFPNGIIAPRVFTVEPNGGKTINEKVGGTGSLTVNDCDGAQVAKITWERGQIQEDGHQVFEAGCQDGGSSSSS